MSAPDDGAFKSYAEAVADITESTHNWKLDIYKNRPVQTLVVPEGLPVFDSMYSEDSDGDEKSKLDCATEHFYTATMGEENMLSQDCCNDTFVLETTTRIRRLKHIYSYMV